MERAIVNKLRESRIMTYKGYNIDEDRDGNFIVTGMKGVIGQFESIDAAQDYIDDMKSSDRYADQKKSVSYAVRVSFEGQREWHYLCKDSKFKSERYVTKTNVRLFQFKNKAEQALKYAVRGLNYSKAEVVVYP